MTSAPLRDALVKALTDIVVDRIELEIELPWLRLKHELEELPIVEQAAREVQGEADAAGARSVKYFGRNLGLGEFKLPDVPDVFDIAKQTAERLTDYLMRNELADRSTSTARKLAAEIDRAADTIRSRRRQLDARADALRAELTGDLSKK